MRLEEAKRKGELKGMTEGIRIAKQEVLESITKRLLQEDEEVDFIMRVTGLSKQNVIDIQQKLNAE